MLQPMDYSTKEEFINDQYEKLSETGKTKFRMKVAKKSIDLDSKDRIAELAIQFALFWEKAN